MRGRDREVARLFEAVVADRVDEGGFRPDARRHPPSGGAIDALAGLERVTVCGYVDAGPEPGPRAVPDAAGFDEAHPETLSAYVDTLVLSRST